MKDHRVVHKSDTPHLPDEQLKRLWSVVCLIGEATRGVVVEPCFFSNKLFRTGVVKESTDLKMLSNAKRSGTTQEVNSERILQLW